VLLVAARPEYSRIGSILTDQRRQTAKRNARESEERFATRKKRGDTTVAEGDE